MEPTESPTSVTTAVNQVTGHATARNTETPITVATVVAMDPEEEAVTSNAWKTPPPDAANGCTNMGDFDGTCKWKPEHNRQTLYWCDKYKRWSTTHWTNEHCGTPSANLAGLAVLGEHDSDEDWRCVFHASPLSGGNNSNPSFSGNYSDDSSSGLSDGDYWSLVTPYFPLFLCLLWWYFGTAFAPTIWFSVTFALYHGPSTFFADPFAYRLCCNPWQRLKRLLLHPSRLRQHQNHHRDSGHAGSNRRSAMEALLKSSSGDTLILWRYMVGVCSGLYPR
jgi:hypothetical protein